MKNYLLTVSIFLLATCAKAFPNNDTTYSYMDEHWKKAQEQNAFYKVEVFKTGNLWHQQIFKIENAALQYDNVYSDKRLKTKEDTSKNYQQGNGEVLEEIFKKGKELKAQLITKDANILGYEIFDNDGKIIEQKGYDENGNEIPNYVFMQEASFPGGLKFWQTYLIVNLNQNVPANNHAPIGTYKVVVSFLINKDGNATEVKALNDPGFGMAEEAVRVISNSPQWNPAIMYNKAVTYRQKQGIIFNVTK
ncbi:hypothetical protein A9P82_11295 [Arachidicoccus ginsenosidimutans]|uniref:energy transducer TonB n=1 Tax=Arachidicoccus sp. BS20 TaxID=1850526 RepID=UPI0007F0E693|nr:energy transducer TonB [Arachidicoccus sp. BS20]ANI89823.1 hypothetical protein A9P82_11295 [Arachidicoccus sp. BS20]